MLTAKELRKRYVYDPESGIFTRRVQAYRWSAGSVAGSIHKGHGYVVLTIDRRKYQAHRVAWLYMTGRWPSADIDHVNLCRTDNRWSNLRAATRQQNCFNRPARRDSGSGLKGVTFNKRLQKWVASICANRQQRHIGCFTTPEAAHAAYVAEAARAFGKFARAA
jgi:hypothetical protein